MRALPQLSRLIQRQRSGSPYASCCGWAGDGVDRPSTYVLLLEGSYIAY
jgi:hypothetical protein